MRFARARFGMYDTIEFVIVLLGYARSFERTLDACYARLFPLVEVCMALFDRERLPDRSTLSRFFSAPGRTTVKALRTQFQTDRLARIPFTSVGGGLFKTQVQPVVNAVAINLVRIDAVLTRTSLHEPSARES